MGEQGGAEQHLRAVGQADPEGPFGLSGVEALLPRHQGRDLSQRDPHRVGQSEGPRGRAHPLRSPGQELVVEQPAQAGEIVAHGRLAKADPHRGACNAPLQEQGVQGDEQVQIEAT